jgi:hypothetical protein
MATKLSEHFTLEEMTYSDTAKAKKISNIPTNAHLCTLTHTCLYLLEPLRDLLIKTYNCQVIICINSGYRGKELNKAVNGVSTSQHCSGEAADIRCYKVINGTKTLIPYADVYEHIKEYVYNGLLSVDQCILEQSGSAIWVHVSHSAWGKTKDRRQFLKYKNGRYTTDTYKNSKYLKH